MSTLTGVWVQDGALRRSDAKGATAEVEPMGRQSGERSRKSRPGTAGKTKSGMEALRARSTQRAKQVELPELPVVSDLPPPKSREGMGRQFTVGNVGHGGMIFLKPVERPSPRKPPVTQASNELSPTSTATTSPVPSPQPPPPPINRSTTTTTTTTTMTTTTTSTIPPVPPVPAKHIPPPTKTMFNAAHQRSFSQSTIDARLANEKVEASTMKIVIDRHEAAKERGKAEANGEFPSLRVSIPHYRLGSPRFSARGTAFWRGSIYTMSSMTGDHQEPTSIRGLGGDLERMLAPQGLGTHAILSRRHSHTSPQPYELQASHGSIYTGIGAQAYIMPIHTGPISPQMFDAVANDPHSPTIVHYSPINGEILAATPARLIAQITSDNFLDYELLSDFFLTVRSYMSTRNLLAYLMARFEWAINRFDDNGRVIRVRAFAALRHWILNYFPYDFLVDRDLRLQLCDRLNALTKIVKARADYGTSDLKLIADLKKCWNGRCSHYWDRKNFPIDAQQDADIQPGGSEGSNEGLMVHQAQLQFAPVTTIPPQLALSPAQLTAGTPSIANWYTAVMEHSAAHARVHARQSSDATSRSLPLSPTSEQSVPVLSCSIPTRTLRRAFPFASRALSLHPIPANPSVHPLPPAAASAIASGASRVADIRYGSGSLDEADDGLQHTVPPSLLRGYAIVPSSPIVYAIPTTPGLEISVPAFAQGGRNSDQARKGVAQPPVKSFLGNIRRALSSRYTPQPQAGHTTASAHNSAPALGKSAQVPFNVVYEASTSGQLEQYRGTRRVDLLGQKTFEAYQNAVDYARNATNGPPADIGVALGNESAQPSPFGIEGHRPSYGFEGLQPPEFRRKASTMTEGSQSIVIFDDTHSSEPPVPPVPRINTDIDPAVGASEQTPKVSPSTNRPAPPELDRERNTFGHPRAPFVFPLPPQDPNQSLQQHVSNTRHTQASSISLRRYASFQSTLSRGGHDRSTDGVSRSTERHELPPRAPARMLRRRPGGDLRANQNVQDLEGRRPKSAGSITTYAESIRDSFPGSFGERIRGTFDMKRPSQRAAAAAAGAPTESTDPARPRYSFVQAHSSMPEKRRPSFEAAVAEFAHIPDDDEGGIEATLLKLEGKYKIPNQSPVETRQPPPRPNAPEPPPSTGPEDAWNQRLESSENADEEAADGHSSSNERETVGSGLYAGSEDSYNSVPLLERGSHDGPHEKASTFDSVSVPLFSMENAPLVEPRAGTRRGRYASAALTATTDSFLLDEDDDFLSDVSSELSVDTIEPSPSQNGAHQQHTDQEDHILIGREHPPSPPMTMQNAMKISSQTNQAREQRKPPTPDTSPIEPHVEPSTPPAAAQATKRSPDEPQHMPFILGFEAETIAQQLTILEQEALKEVDWRDVVDMRWQSTATSTMNWVEYLATQDPIGIDLVTARFNIMVKWALSEIVLTENVEERALAIMKYIHIAHSARTLHNYATLLQMTIALTSPDCTRLGRTWNLVPEADKEILQDLEMLVSPKKNFHNLRNEMEKVNADEGCIPVLALYTHDLIYNAQKPAQIPGSMDGGEPLINFERFRSTAVIVKNLLRMIDASTKYQLSPLHGLIDRCLWMAALPDEEIASRSKQLEFT